MEELVKRVKKANRFRNECYAHDKFSKEANITLNFYNGEKKTFTIETTSLVEVLKNSDFVTLHVPKTNDKSVIEAEEIGLMKTGAGIINTSRGGLIDEDAFYVYQTKVN